LRHLTCDHLARTVTMCIFLRFCDSVCDSLGNRHNFYILKPDPAYSAPNEILGIWNPLSSHSSLFVIKNQKNPLTLTAPITQIQINKPCSPNFSNDEASSSPFQSLTCSNPSKSLNPHRSIVLSSVRFVVLLFVCSLVVSDNEASLSLLRFDVPVIATPPPPEPSLTASRSLPLAVDYHHQVRSFLFLNGNHLPISRNCLWCFLSWKRRGFYFDFIKKLLVVKPLI
jgi:hypothetical protein